MADAARPVRPRYYGWTIALALAISETVSWGILYYSFSVFQVSMEQALDATRAQLSGAFSIALLLSGLAAVPVGWWIDRHGARGLMTAGSLCAVALVWAWSRVETLAQLYLVLGGIGLTMAAVLYEPAFAVITVWFVRNRRRALTLLTLVAGLASTIFLPLANWLLIQQGWRPALVTLAAILFVMTVPLHALVLRRRPQDEGLLPDGEMLAAEGGGLRPTDPRSATAGEALHSVSFWSLTISFVLSSAVGVGVGLHFIPYLVEQGYGGTMAASVAGLIGFMQVFGRIFFVPLSRWLPRHWLVTGILIVQAGALLILTGVREMAGVLIFVILFGMTNGVLTLARAASVSDFYGPAAYGSINGVLSFWATLARAAGPTILALLYTRWGQYEIPLVILTGVTALAALAYYVADHHRERERAIEGLSTRLAQN